MPALYDGKRLLEVAAFYPLQPGCYEAVDLLVEAIGWRVEVTAVQRNNRGLVEMSRGCPEKCNYCWVSYSYGRLRTYDADAILARVDELSHVKNRIGFVATAVGDHPDLAAILSECRGRHPERKSLVQIAGENPSI